MSDQPAARTPEQIRRDIEHTRADLASTVNALAERADVRARALERIEAAKARLGEVAGSERVEAAKARFARARGHEPPAAPSPGAAYAQAVSSASDDMAASRSQTIEAAGAPRPALPPAWMAAVFVAGLLVGRMVASRRRRRRR